MPEFTTPAPIAVRVKMPAGEIDVTATPTDQTTVELRPKHEDDQAAWQLVEDSRVEMDGTHLVVDVPERGRLVKRTPELHLRIRLPVASRVGATLGSADLRAVGPLSALDVKSASGDVSAEEVGGDVGIHLASGDATLRRVGGRIKIHCASGDVDVRSAAGDVQAHTASGDIVIGDAQRSVTARSASGDVTIESAHRGSVDVTTASGDVRVGVAPGTGVYLDLSSMGGRTSSELTSEDEPANGPDLRVRVRTMSGDIDVVRAALTPVTP